VLGLAEDGVGYAVDENNADLISEQMTGAVEDAKQAIIDGEITVHDYSTDDSCPALTF
jgi:basic membrane protein A